MGQTNSAQREPETRGPYNEPIAIFDEFGRITNFFMMNIIYCIHGVIQILERHIEKKAN